MTGTDYWLLQLEFGSAATAVEETCRSSHAGSKIRSTSEPAAHRQRGEDDDVLPRRMAPMAAAADCELGFTTRSGPW
jgi:hypothetical protein